MNSFARPETLNSTHLLSAFSCGKPPLDEFLRVHALGNQKAMLSRTYVVTSSSGIVVAYYTLAHIAVTRGESPIKIARGMPSNIPALLLARFAVDQNLQGRGLGRSLFADATRRTWAVMRDGSAPVRFFVVDAKDEQAKSFYENLHMVPSPVNPMRLFLHYKDLQSLFEPV